MQVKIERRGDWIYTVATQTPLSTLTNGTQQGNASFLGHSGNEVVFRTSDSHIQRENTPQEAIRPQACKMHWLPLLCLHEGVLFINQSSP